MPELPEVETVRRTLLLSAGGRRVIGVTVRRRDVVRGGAGDADLLVGRRVVGIDRLGKQFALIGSANGSATPRPGDACVCVHLGMTGSLRYVAENGAAGSLPDHTHLVWQLDGGARLVFRDPRRFGGVWTFGSLERLHRDRWSLIGPDALSIRPRELHTRLRATRRGIKVALLDQAVLAGLGNIYADELLFACGLHPLTPACTLGLPAVRGLVRRMRRLLGRAIEAGGSTLRDYVDGDGRSGRFQNRHLVYGRSGEPCRRCGEPLEHIVLSGRTSVFCPGCQSPPARDDLE